MVSPEGSGNEHPEQHEVLTVAQAARALGITSSAVRSRIQRGHLFGYKEDGQWRVVLNSHDSVANDRAPARIEEFANSRTDVNEAARQQLEMIRDEWLQPFVDQLTDQAERIGRLENERDELRRRVDELEASRSRSYLDEEELEEPRPRLPRPIIQWRLLVVIVVWALWMAAVVWLWWQFIW